MKTLQGLFSPLCGKDLGEVELINRKEHFD